jgi:hypothetical protein
MAQKVEPQTGSLSYFNSAKIEFKQIGTSGVSSSSLLTDYNNRSCSSNVDVLEQ